MLGLAWLVRPVVAAYFRSPFMTTMQQELEQLERQYWDAIKRKDLPTLLRMTDNPCVVAGAQGAATVDHRMYEQMLNGGGWTVRDFTLSDVVVHMPADDVAIVAYRVREELDVKGEPVTLDAADASTWVKRNGQWVCSLHTESVIGDP